MAEGAFLGSVRADVVLDLAGLESQINRATQLLSRLENQSRRASSAAASSGGGANGGALGLNSRVLSVLTQQLSGVQGVVGNVARSVSNLGSGFGDLTSAMASGEGAALGAEAGIAGAGAAAEAGGGAFASLAGGVGLSATGIGLLAGVILIGIGALKLISAAARAAKDEFIAMAQGGAQLATLNTAISAVARNSGVSKVNVDKFTQGLANMNIFGNQAKQSILQLLNAQIPLNDSSLKLAGSAQNIATAYGQDTATTFATITDAITSLNTVQLQQFGITENLDVVYGNYAATLGRSAASLSEYEKRQALINQVNLKGAQFAGVYADAQGNVQKKYEQLGSRIQTITGSLGTALQPALYSIIAPLEGIATAAAKFLSDPTVQGKLQTLGNMIAGYIKPAIDGLYNALANAPWGTFASLAYSAAQILQLVGRVLFYVGQTFVDIGRIAVGFGQIIVGALTGPMAALGELANLAGQVFEVFRSGGKAKIDLGQSYANVTSAFNKGLQTIGSGVNNIAKGASDANRHIQDLAKGVYTDLNQAFAGFDFKKFWNSLSSNAGKSWQEALGISGDGMNKLSADALKKLADLAREMAQENENFAYDQANKARDFADSLGELVARHKEAYAKIITDIQKENDTFNKASDDRRRKYEDDMAKITDADRQRKNDVQTQIAEELAKGRYADRLKLASLRSRLNYEDSQTQKATTELNSKYQEDTQNAQDAHNTKLSDLQTELDKEKAIQVAHAADFAAFRDYQIADDISKLHTSYDRQRAEDARAHALRLADFARRGAEITSQNAQQGYKAGAAMGQGITGGLASTMPGINSLSNALGQQSQQNVQGGANQQAGNTRNTIWNVLWGALTNLPIVGPAFSIGKSIFDWVQNGMGGSGGAVKQTVINIMNYATDIAGNIGSFGARLISQLGKVIYNALPGALKGAFQGTWNGIGLPRFQYGGIVGGVPGNDQNVIRATKGEMILTRAQQGSLFSMIQSGQTSSNSGGGDIHIDSLNITLPNVANGNDFTRDLKLTLGTLR